MNTFMQMPEKVTIEEIAGRDHCRFIMQPLEPGYGVTVGNALRRILLSSIPGSAIIGVKISDVLHEYQTIPGVVEDVTEIILNLKEIRLKLKDESVQKVHFHIRGKGTWTAASIEEASPEIEVMNPEHHIATLAHDADFDVELRFGTGKGYITAEELQMTDYPIGMLALDAIYTPIRNVIYNIEPFRVGQRTDYEKLIIDVRTDGTINAEEAVKKASQLMMEHVRYFISTEEVDKYDEPIIDLEMEEHLAEISKTKELLDMSVDDLELSVRVHNCLKAANIKRVADLVRFQESELLKFRNFGRKSMTELIQKIRDMGLEFGTNIEQYYRYDRR